MKQSSKKIAIFSLSSVFVLSLCVTKTYASPVTISQTGSVVTAKNGMLTITYDLSIGSAGTTNLIGKFYSDYGVSGSSTRISSFDSGTSTNNKYGFAYSDSNPYANGFERLSTNSGSTWTTESSGNRDLMFSIYK